MMLEHDPADRGRQGEMRAVVFLAFAGLVGAELDILARALRVDRDGGRRRLLRPAAVAGIPPPLSIRAITAPTATVSPSATSCSPISAGDRRGHLDRDLVGLEAGDRLVGLDRVAGLLEPLAERRLGDRFAQGRDFDFGRHVVPLSGLALRRRVAAMAERVGDQGRLLGGVALGKAGGRRGEAARPA